jgi:hypothetical protein
VSTPPSPPAPVGDLGLVPTKTGILAGWMLKAVTEELVVCGGGPADVTMITPGSRPPPADWVCQRADPDDPDEQPAEGMAWVRINRRYPTENFPGAATKASCVAPLAAELEVGVYRCAYTLTDAGAPPAPEDVTADALKLDADAHALLSAIRRLKWPYVLGTYTTLGPSGGVVGGAQMFTVLLSSGPIGRERT